MYYFAYGSNMNREQMKTRCPDAKFLKRVYLADYKLVYDGNSSLWKSPVANIVRSKKDTVWGALFQVDMECIKSLDRYEGVPTSYKRESVEVKDEQGNTYQALAYLRKPRKIGKPSDEYRRILTDGARDCGLPEEYVEKITKV